MPDLNHYFKYRQKKKSAEYILGLVLIVLEIIKMIFDIFKKKMGRFCDKPSSVPYADSHIAYIVR